MSSSSSSAGHCPPTIHELLCCLRNSQEPCRHSCHASSMICRGQRIAVEGRRGMLLPACRLQPAGVEALVRTKKNLHGGILKRLLLVCFNGEKKNNEESLLYVARGSVWKSLSMLFLSHQTSILQLFLLLTILHSYPCLGAVQE